MPLTTTARLQLEALYTKASDLSTPEEHLDFIRSIALASGVGADQADKLFNDKRTVAASATDTLDLAAALIDAFGQSLTFVKLKGLIVFAAKANANNVRVARSAVNGVPLFLAAGDAIDILPGGLFVWIAPGAGVTVTAGTGDLLDIVNSGAGTSVEYDVIIFGTSA